MTFEIEDLGRSQADRDPRRLRARQHRVTMVSEGWPQVISALKTLLETGDVLEGTPA